jgi:hypothetical protein
MPSGFEQNYTQTFSSFSGADIVATFGSKVFGSLQAITYTVQREVAPVYTWGSSEPRSFSKGKRGIGGSLIFVVFDKDALLDTLLKNLGSNPEEGRGFTAFGNLPPGEVYGVKESGMDSWNERTAANNLFGSLNTQNIEYLDQFPPFNITVSMANEYGQTSSMQILGVQILSEGLGMSIDDMVIEKACSFVARSVVPIGHDKMDRSGKVAKK